MISGRADFLFHQLLRRGEERDLLNAAVQVAAQGLDQSLRREQNRFPCLVPDAGENRLVLADLLVVVLSPRFSQHAAALEDTGRDRWFQGRSAQVSALLTCRTAAGITALPVFYRLSRGCN